MKIDISNLPSEVESLHKVIASLQNKNKAWSSKYQKLEQEKSALAANHSKLSVSHIGSEYKMLRTRI